MAGQIKVLVALDAGVDRDTIHAAIPSDIHVVGFVDGLEESPELLETSGADVLAVACAGHSERALLLVARVAKRFSDRAVVVLAHGTPNGFVRSALEAGADDLVMLPDLPDRVRFAIEKAVVRRRGAVRSAGPSPLICVLGPKGGTGKTLTASNLGVALATAGSRVVLVDLDLQFGDVGLALGLTPDRTMADLARTGSGIDPQKVEEYVTPHESGLRVLLAPTRPDHAALVTVPFMKELYGSLRATNDYVVVDTPPGFTPEVIATIDNATHVLMVATLDALSLKNTKLGLETLDLMGFGSDRVSVLLNRADARVGIERSDAVAILGREPDVLVPSDRDVSKSVNEAVPIVLSSERSDAARAFRALSERFLRAAEEASPNGAAPEQSSRRLFSLGRKS